MMLSLRLLCSAVLLLCVCEHAVSWPSVVLGDGATVEGVTLPVDDSSNTVFAFLGIPFAEPPVGPRRFARAQPLQSPPRTVNATVFGASCIQFDTYSQSRKRDSNGRYPNQSEDCLSLNIFTPSNASLASKVNAAEQLPVMFWVYGGGFIIGSSDEPVRSPHVYATTQDRALCTVEVVWRERAHLIARAVLLWFVSRGAPQRHCCDL